MNPVTKYEKTVYFRSNMDYLISCITHEDNYLIWKYMKFLRAEEAATNKLTAYFWRRKKNDLGSKLGIQIYAGTCEPGLHIWHYSSTLISGDAKIGRDCVFHGQACIGSNGITTDAPVIGNRVDIGVGAKIIGGVTIADDVIIGAGAVVTKSCLEPGSILAGVPAKVIGKR